MFEQRDQNAAETSGEHAALAPTLPTHLLIAPNGSACWRGHGCHLRAATYPQQPESRNGDRQPQPGGPLGVFHPCMLPLPTAALAVLEPLLDPTPQPIPGSIALLRQQITQDQPRLLVPDAPPAQQRAGHLPTRRRKRRARATPTLPFLGYHPFERHKRPCAVGAEASTCIDAHKRMPAN